MHVCMFIRFSHVWLFHPMDYSLPGSSVHGILQTDPLEEGMATHSSILAWRIPWQRSLVDYSPLGHRVRHEWRDLACTLWPITCSCLFSGLEAMKWGRLDPIWLRIISIWVFLSVNTSSPLFWGVRRTLSPDLHFRVLNKIFSDEYSK